MSERTESEIRESIETTRARMGETIEQIGDRVNPERVKADLKARARNQIHEAGDNMKRKARNTMRDVEHGVSDTGRSIWATIRENPVPAGMVGVGLAWLIANRRNAGEQREFGTYSTGPAVPYRPGYGGRGVGPYGSAGEYGGTESYTESGAYGATGGYSPLGSTGAADADADPTAGFAGTAAIHRDYEDQAAVRAAGFSTAGTAQFRGDGPTQESQGLRGKASNALHSAGERIEEAQERVGEAVHGARERIGQTAHETQDRVSNLAQQAKYRAQRAEQRVEDSLRENPVAAGAMALAIGVAAGLMIPESQREHEVLGRTRDRALDKAQDAARRSAEKMHDAARDAAAETARHVVDEVWPGGVDAQSESFSEPRR